MVDLTPTTKCNACVNGEVAYDTTDEWNSWDDMAKTPCPMCQSTTTLEISVSTLAYLAYDYFREVMDTAEANRLSEVFTTALKHCATKIVIPATEDMVEQFHDFLDGARP